MSLNNLSRLLKEVGRDEEAEDARREAAEPSTPPLDEEAA
jgi:hypothetical protein